MTTFPKLVFLAAIIGLGGCGGRAAAESISAHVVEVDMESRCLSIDWHNDSHKQVCWSEATELSELDSGEARSATDLRPGAYLRIEGEDGAVFQATHIEIWEAASEPPSDG